MPQKSGMFDWTIENPREYPAREFAEKFARLITNGVFNGGQYLRVTATGTDSYISISLGAAWINGYDYSVYDEAIALAVTPATTMDRIDRIVLRLDTSTPVSSIEATVLQGVPNTNPVPPALVRSGDIYDLSLAQVIITANSTIITQAKITDERLDQNVCGLVNSLIQVDTATFQQQWDAFLASVQSQGFATAIAFNAHTSDTTKHITPAERTMFTNKETTAGAQTKATTAENNAKAASLPITGGALTGPATANSNTSYTTKQIRNITLSTANPTGGATGDIWIKYV